MSSMMYKIYYFILTLLATSESNEHQHARVSFVRSGRQKMEPFIPEKTDTRQRVATKVPFNETVGSLSFMRYCDTEEPVRCQDPFMNRIVALVIHIDRKNEEDIKIQKGQVVTTGVLISNDHVLTSYNPFRRLQKKLFLNVMVLYTYRATWYLNREFHGYLIEMALFDCARQVAATIKEQWQGADKKHSPVHDLMVFRTLQNVSVGLGDYWKTERGDAVTNVGPLVTEIARPQDHLSDKLTFASLGFLDDDHIEKMNRLHTVELHREDRVLVNCDEWFLRDWGYFICIRNVGDYLGIGSGAFLFSEGKVFGVGSFALRKGNQSILAFTDVRVYYRPILAACTKADGQGRPQDGPDDIETTTKS